MPFHLERHVEPGYLYYVVDGETTVESMHSLADALHRDCTEFSRTAVLLDCGAMRGALSVPQLFEVGRYFAERLGPEIWLAGINMPEAWQDNRFSENVIQNRGGELQHFASREDAVSWLESRQGSRA